MRNSIIISILLVFSLFNCSSPAKEKVLEDEQSRNLSFTLIDSARVETSIRALEVIAEDTVWFAGSNNRYGYSTNGGKSWQMDSLLHEGLPLEFRALAHTTSHIFMMNVASPAFIFKKSKAPESSWEVVYEERNPNSFYNAMAFWDDSLGIATGDPTEGCLSILLTTDGGNSWEKVPCNELPPTAKGEAEFAASNTNIALSGANAWIATGGTRARVFHTSNYGATWAVQETPMVEGGQMTGIYSIAFYDENNGIMIGGDWNDKMRNTQNKATTNNGGKQWKLIAEGAEPGYRSCIQYLGENKKHMIAVGSPGISLSNDGGENWSLADSSGFYTVRVASSGKKVWLAGRNKLAIATIK